MENEKDILEMVVMEIETWTRSCTRKADKYQKDMDEDYVHFFLLAFGGHVQGAVEAEGVPRVGEGGKPRKSGRREGVPETHGGALQRRPDIRFSAEPQH